MKTPLQPENVKHDKNMLMLLELRKYISPSNSKNFIRGLHRIISVIRKSFSPSEVEYFIQNVPGILQLIFISDWKYETSPVKYVHLDDLVDDIIIADRNSDKPLFRSRLEVINAVSIVFKKMDEYMGLLHFPGINESLKKEINDMHFNF